MLIGKIFIWEVGLLVQKGGHRHQALKKFDEYLKNIESLQEKRGFKLGNELWNRKSVHIYVQLRLKDPHFHFCHMIFPSVSKYPECLADYVESLVPVTMEMSEVAQRMWRILIGHRFFFALLVQAFFLHPCYQASAPDRWIRLSMMPIIISWSLSSMSIRQWEPIDEFFHMNFPIVSFATFHTICLAVEFGLFQGSVLDCPRTIVNEPEKGMTGLFVY